MRLLTVLLPWSVLLGSACSSGPPIQRDTPPDTSLQAGAQEQPAPFVPPVPVGEDFDWLRMSSGEWLKGRLILLRKDSLEFDSDEFDDLSLDWDDVEELRSPVENTVRLRGGEVLVGTVLVRDGVLVVGTEEGERRFPRSQLYTLLPGQPSERNYWRGKWSLGTTARRGNTDQLDASTSLSLSRRTAASRFLLDVDANYSEIESEKSADSQRLNSSFRTFVDERFYLTPASLIASRDPFQNIDLRATPGAGLGYLIVDRGDLEWEAGTGLGLIYTRYSSVQPGEDREESSGAWLLGTRARHDLTATVELELVYDMQLALNSGHAVNHHATFGISVDLLNDLDLDVSLVWDHVGDPARDDDGVRPEKDDFRLYIGLGWEF